MSRDSHWRTDEPAKAAAHPAPATKEPTNEHSPPTLSTALAPRPRLIVRDEPVSALAPSTRARALDSFVALREPVAVARHVGHRVSVRFHRGVRGTDPAGELASILNTPPH